jgi:hypothetical protein
MLFGYPVEATHDNWFHDCLIEILAIINTSVQQKKSPPNWPNILPKPYRAKLSSRYGLKKKLIDYQTALETLNNNELNQVIKALNEQNQIELLLSGGGSCERIDDLPVCIHEPVKKLFEFVFKLLSELDINDDKPNLKIRDYQYKIIYDKRPHICPFCGFEYFDAPGARRVALDHYLAESKYPFAGVNLCNLVPMGDKCNSKKLAQDILYKDDGTRRKSYYPYGHTAIKISLENSKPFEGSYQSYPVPLWQIDFDPDSEETSTWDTVFHIRERYKRDILNPKFNSWFQEFSYWCCSALIAPVSDEKVIEALRRYSNYLENTGMEDRAFLKAAVFRMLHYHCQQGNQRVFNFIKRLVPGGMA